ncbi:hypothetical protein [Streptomyces sp. NPDC054958]
MTTPLSPTTIQRLAFVRFLHEQGIAQSSQPEPLSAAAVLSFQDAVEHFLLIAADHLKVNLPSSMQFLQYWERLNPSMPVGQELPSKQALDRVNKIRVALKHYGTIPSTQAISQAKADVTTFFTDATQMIFNVDFGTVDMVDLVAREETSKFLHEAHTHAVAGNVIPAMAGLVLAMEELLDYYTGDNQHRRHWPTNPFQFGPKLDRYRDPTFPLDTARPELKQVERLTETVSRIQEAMQVMALGIDYAKYIQFRAISPAIGRYFAGPIRIHFSPAHRSLTLDDYRTSRLFVIESALRATRADATLARTASHYSAIEEVATTAQYVFEEMHWTGSAEPAL